MDASESLVTSYDGGTSCQTLSETLLIEAGREPRANGLLGFFEIAEEKTHPGMIHPGRTQFPE
jgi:hypothetical protein